MTQTSVIQTFDSVQKLLTDSLGRMTDKPLFYVEIGRDEIWDNYLMGFTEENRQERNCSACRSFLRQFGGIVTIEDNKVVSIWEHVFEQIDINDGFKAPIQNLLAYIYSLPVTDVFLSDVKKCGTKQNFDHKLTLVWKHFYLELPQKFVTNKKDLPAKLAQARDDKAVLKRSLDELTLSATETVLELIGQNSLYRGKEFDAILNKFALLQRRYVRLPEGEKDNFAWMASGEAGSVISRIRNTAIGTLLIDLSAGVDLDTAVTRFEKVVAPHSYKRPTSLVTPRMIEEAKTKLTELGLVSSLERRYANEADIPVFNLIYKDKPQVLTDVFNEMAKDAAINPRTLAKSEEISIQDFLANVVPTATSIQVLLENNQLTNFVSLLAPQDPSAPALFKWGNGFSWSYAGNIADSIKERVKEAGGNVDGELRTSLSWSNHDDLDIHVYEPGGAHIFYGNKISYTSRGQLDVDMNAGHGTTRSPVENIIWTDKSRMREGVYRLVVHNYSRREERDPGFAVQVECHGEVFDFEFRNNPKNGEYQDIATFEYTKAGGVKFQGEVKSNFLSKEKWGLNTNRWHKVTQLLLSPNHWDGGVGNKHYLFMLEGCISDEAPRPFFNEFLKPELDAHRKVFEILGSKVKVEPTDNQLSGLGFSETQRASLIVRVTSKFARTLKINF